MIILVPGADDTHRRMPGHALELRNALEGKQKRDARATGRLQYLCESGICEWRELIEDHAQERFSSVAVRAWPRIALTDHELNVSGEVFAQRSQARLFLLVLRETTGSVLLDDFIDCEQSW